MNSTLLVPVNYFSLKPLVIFILGKKLRARRCNFDYFLRFVFPKTCTYSYPFNFFKFFLIQSFFLTFYLNCFIYFLSFRKKRKKKLNFTLRSHYAFATFLMQFSNQLLKIGSLNHTLFFCNNSFTSLRIVNIRFPFFLFNNFYLNSFCFSKNFFQSCFARSRLFLTFKRFSQFFFSKTTIRNNLFSLLPTIHSFTFFIYFLNYQRKTIFHDTRERRFLFSENPVFNLYFSLSSFYRKRFEMREYFYHTLYKYSSFLSILTSLNLNKMKRAHLEHTSELFDDRKDFNFLTLHSLKIRPQLNSSTLLGLTRKTEFFSIFDYLDEDFLIFQSLLVHLDFIKKKSIVNYIHFLFQKFKDLTFFFFFKLITYRNWNSKLQTYHQNFFNSTIFFNLISSSALHFNSIFCLDFSFFSLFFSFKSLLCFFCFRFLFFSKFSSQFSFFFPLRSLTATSLAKLSYSLVRYKTSSYFSKFFFKTSQYIRRSLFFFKRSRFLRRRRRHILLPRTNISLLSLNWSNCIKKNKQRLLLFFFFHSWSRRCLRFGTFPLNHPNTSFLKTKRFKSLFYTLSLRFSKRLKFLGRPRRRLAVSFKVLVSMKKVLRQFHFSSIKTHVKLTQSKFRRKISAGAPGYLLSKIALMTSKFHFPNLSPEPFPPIFSFTRFFSLTHKHSRISLWRHASRKELSLDIQFFGRIRSPIFCSSMLIGTTHAFPVLSFNSCFSSSESLFSSMYFISFLRFFTVPSSYFFTYLDHRRLHFTETRTFNIRFTQHILEYKDENQINFNSFVRKHCHNFFLQNWFPNYSDVDSFFGFFFARSGLFFRHLISSLASFLVQPKPTLNKHFHSHFFFFKVSPQVIKTNKVNLFESYYSYFSFFFFTTFFNH